MLGLIRKTDNVMVAAVESVEGYDLTEYDARQLPDGDPLGWVWDGAQFVARPQTASEQADAAMKADQLWTQLETATPAQIETWLTSNVTDLASARRVLKFILLALKSLRTARRL